MGAVRSSLGGPSPLPQRLLAEGRIAPGGGEREVETLAASARVEHRGDACPPLPQGRGPVRRQEAPARLQVEAQTPVGVVRGPADLQARARLQVAAVQAPAEFDAARELPPSGELRALADLQGQPHPPVVGLGLRQQAFPFLRLDPHQEAVGLERPIDARGVRQHPASACCGHPQVDVRPHRAGPAVAERCLAPAVAQRGPHPESRRGRPVHVGMHAGERGVHLAIHLPGAVVRLALAVARGDAYEQVLARAEVDARLAGPDFSVHGEVLVRSILETGCGPAAPQGPGRSGAGRGFVLPVEGEPEGGPGQCADRVAASLAACTRAEHPLQTPRQRRGADGYGTARSKPFPGQLRMQAPR